MWVFASSEVVCFDIQKSRSADVLTEHFGDDAKGLISADRYSAYKKLMNSTGQFAIAFCWAHVRRDFVRVVDSYEGLEEWGQKWKERIDLLFAINNRRMAGDNSDVFARITWVIRRYTAVFFQRAEDELKCTELKEYQTKALESLLRHREGLTLFIDHPQVLMDNNPAERLIRPGALARKVYYGSFAVWMAQLQAMMMSIFATLKLWEIDERKWLSLFFQYEVEGRRAETTSLLPWNLSKGELIDLRRLVPDSS